MVNILVGRPCEIQALLFTIKPAMKVKATARFEGL
jgi:hypothetical protein